ncbi:MAG: putative lipid II flippase FtsW [Coriobacteriales bacterium]|jgi:cell division protein FtsW|nr:putative lipid II flippase FtsW [Coriobacteriales bacterium]
MSSRKATGTSVARNQGVASTVLGARMGFLAIVAVLLVFGLVMLYSASSVYSYNISGDYTAIFLKQTIMVAVGIVIALFIAFFPYSKYTLTLCSIALLVTIPLLALVLVGGNDALGARRWIDLGFTTLQPSEFTKIALIMVLAHLVDRCRINGYSRSLIVVMIISCAIPIGLIVIEPDLGTTIIAIMGILAVLWFGGVPKRVVAILAVALVVLAAIAIFGSGFRQNRISSWLDPWSDPQAGGYQLLNSYYAFGGGGVFGVGLGLSRQKFNWLPQSENDFLFAIVGEELGLVGALIIVLLFIGLVFMALRIARDAPDILGRMIAGTSGVIIGLQAFLNMLCVLGAIPTTGKPLPFFSAGGSSIISTMILVGLILSVSLQSRQANIHDFRREQFTVVSGGRQRNSLAGVGDSVLSWLPNPAALVEALMPRQQQPQPQRRQRPAMPPPSSRNAPARPVPADKIVPISRGRADRVSRQHEELSKKRLPRHSDELSRRHTDAPAFRHGDAPLSMSSLRRNRVRQSGGKSA